jgi:hypothetical protein
MANDIGTRALQNADPSDCFSTRFFGDLRVGDFMADLLEKRYGIKLPRMGEPRAAEIILNEHLSRVFMTIPLETRYFVLDHIIAKHRCGFLDYMLMRIVNSPPNFQWLTSSENYRKANTVPDER